jgi:hypothetical protein
MNTAIFSLALAAQQGYRTEKARIWALPIESAGLEMDYLQGLQEFAIAAGREWKREQGRARWQS